VNPLAIFGLSPLKTWLIGGAVAALFAWGWAGHHSARSLKTTLLTEERGWASQVAAQQKLVAAETQRRKAQEDALRIAKENADHVLTLEREESSKRLALERSASVGLRRQLAAAAAGASASAPDSLSACRDRASTFGDVLGTVLLGFAECTGAAEDNAGGVRALLNSWPR
jgi:hypothetical protein